MFVIENSYFKKNPFFFFFKYGYLIKDLFYCILHVQGKLKKTALYEIMML